MRHFCGYIRVSTVKQGEKGVSLQEQKDAIIRHAERANLDIIEWFEERQTAAKSGRPVFNRMLRLLREQKAEGVIIHKIDRSARNLMDWACLGQLLDSGVEVHFANENLDLHSRGGRLSADIQAVVAADYIRNLREETKKGFYGRLKQGLYPMAAPVGYLDKGKGKCKEPDPVQAPLVQKAFELYATGRYTLEALNEELRAIGLRSRRGSYVSLNGISYILNNPFYVGLIRIFKTGETFVGNHKPLIPKALFDRVQNVLSGKVRHTKTVHYFLFQRLLTCAACDRVLTGEWQKGAVYYRCHTKGCSTCIREERVEENVLSVLAQLAVSDREKEYIAQKLAEMQGAAATSKEEIEKSLVLRLRQIQERLDRLTDAYIDRAIDKDAYEDRKASLLMERREVEEKRATTQADSGGPPEALRVMFELAYSAYQSYKVATLLEKRDLLISLSSNRSVEGKNLSIDLRLPFSEIANRHSIPTGSPQRGVVRTWNDMLLKIFAHYQNLSAC